MDDLAKRLRELIDDAQSDMADDLAHGEYTGERPDLHDYPVDLALDEALALLARIEADAKRIAELEVEGFSLAAWQCVLTDGSGLTGDEHGNQYCRMIRRADAAEARVKELEALLREADRRIAWEACGFGNDFADRVEAALEGEK